MSLWASVIGDQETYSGISITRNLNTRNNLLRGGSSARRLIPNLTWTKDYGTHFLYF